jgi:hypothetical protein
MTENRIRPDRAKEGGKFLCRGQRCLSGYSAGLGNAGKTKFLLDLARSASDLRKGSPNRHLTGAVEPNSL